VSDGRATFGGGYRQQVNTEPLAGYRLLDPLGRGGFGEVWKCEAPGGLHKAIKFVYPDSDGDDTPGESLKQEYDAFQHIKTIRHPFLLMLERVELVAGTLAFVMELADAGLADRFAECQDQGLRGIPRAELLGYLTDAAEALDVISVKHGLQHLDIKPANLFLVGGHVKVGDYGLVSRSNPHAGRHGAGFTPRYAPPELIDGRVDPRSDQYSLALVYFEMLTGTFPFAATSARELMMAHAALDPDLGPLPAGDRPVVARALAKDPEDRFPNCLGFIRGLLTAGPPPPSDVTLRQAKLGQKPLPAGLAPPNPAAGPAAITRSRAPAPGSVTSPTLSLRTPGQSGVVAAPPGMPKLTTPAAKASGVVPPPDARAADPTPPPRPTTPRVSFDTPRPTSDQPTDNGPESVIRLTPASIPLACHRLTDGFRAVLPVPLLTGGIWPGDPPPNGAGFVFTLFESAYGPGKLPQTAADPVRRPDGSWTCRFPARLMAGTVRLKLQAVRERWGGELHQPEPCTFTLLLDQGKGRATWLGKSEPVGLEVTLQLPPPALGQGDVLITGRVYGPADAALVKKAADDLPGVLNDLRKQLQNLPDRRKAPRVPYDGPVVLYPVDEDGAVFPPVAATGVDVSPTGMCVQAADRLSSRYVYAEFPRLTRIAGLAILTELIRDKGDRASNPTVAGIFRTDLDDPAETVAATADLRASYY
jgi:serine/threonine protein kinase